MKKVLFGLLVVILLLGAVGCGQSKEVAYTVAPNTYATRTQLAMPGTAEGKGTFGDAGAPSPIIVPPTTTTPPINGGGSYNYDSSIPVERMVIRSAYMTLVVEDVSGSMVQITNLAAANGGYVVASDMSEQDNRLYANISFRVTSEKFNDTLQALRNLAVDVRSESISGQDVTEEYVDLDAKLRTLEASEAQLLELMKMAGTVEEILKVQQELVNTRSEIEQIKGRMQYLEQSSDLSYISASLEQSKLIVEFIANTSTVKEGDKVQFIPTISGGFSPYSYEWAFGDGETSTEGAPAHTYRQDGTYTVTLIIKDDKGGTANAERKDYITVLTGWDAGNVASSAWNAMVGFGRFLGTVLIGLGIFSPVWIAILVILYFAWWRRRKKKA